MKIEEIEDLVFERDSEQPVIVTGATGGIGRYISRHLSAMDIPLILACRSEEKYKLLEAELHNDFPFLKVEYLCLDLADSRSVREAAASLGDRAIYGLINNAGVMSRRFHIGPDGREDTLNVNYFNTRLLTELILPNIEPRGAVVFTTSVTRKSGRHDNLPGSVTEQTFSQLGTYALSKKLITRYAATLAEEVRERGIRVNCADPGVVDSGMITMHRWYDPLADILFRPFIRRPENGAIPAVRALLSPSTARVFTLRHDHPLL